jgi:hypothetical protein
MNVDDREPLRNTRFHVEIDGRPSAGVVEVIVPEARIDRGGVDGAVQYGPLILRPRF